jgi:hypothetical protein
LSRTFYRTYNLSLFQVLTSLSGAFYQTLSKTSFIECHSRRKTTLAQTLFAKSQTLGIHRRSTKKSLPNVKHSAKCNPWKRVVISRLHLTAVNYAECQVLTLGKITSLASVLYQTVRKFIIQVSSPTLGKVYFYFIFFTKIFYCVPTLLLDLVRLIEFLRIIHI